LQIQPKLSDIKKVHACIVPYINRTPVLTCQSIDRMTGSELYFKCENLQKAGAFKGRGAHNVVFSLTDEEAKKGVVTHSSGNHAGALSLAASKRGIPAYIVMPKTAPKVKVTAVKEYAGQITFCEPTLEARESTADRILKETGAVMVHPYDDYRIIAGQATTALELLEDVDQLDMILAPVGGGGLLSGTALSAKAIRPSICVIGCEPEMADDAYRSIQAGHIIPSVNPKTIADGLLTSLCDKTFTIIRDLVDEIVLVSEEAIINAMRITWERMKIIIEPSAAVCLAAILSNKLNVTGKKVGIILSGGNVDLSVFFSYLEKK